MYDATITLCEATAEITKSMHDAINVELTSRLIAGVSTALSHVDKRHTGSELMTECIKCGVAFDMDRSYCVELGCGVPTPQNIEPELAVISKSKVNKIYTPKTVDPLYTRFASVRYRAKKKQIPFDLTQTLIQNILNQPCVYCNETEGIQLDRKIGEDGYTVANVVPACKRCNTVKSMYLTHAEMMIVAKALGWHHE